MNNFHFPRPSPNHNYRFAAARSPLRRVSERGAFSLSLRAPNDRPGAGRKCGCSHLTSNKTAIFPTAPHRAPPLLRFLINKLRWRKNAPWHAVPPSQPPRPNGKIIPERRGGGGNIINYQMRSFITIRGGGHTRPRKIRANFLNITILCHRSSHLFCSRHFYHHLSRSASWSARGWRRKKKSCSPYFSPTAGRARTAYRKV
jgi:hypothetical protein